jgi:hypothetical protein
VMLWQKKADTKNKSIQVALKCLQIEWPWLVPRSFVDIQTTDYQIVDIKIVDMKI